MSKRDLWQFVVKPADQSHNDRYAPIGVRRLEVPSGWIYQFETNCTVDEAGYIVGRTWGQATFVPDGGAP